MKIFLIILAAAIVVAFILYFTSSHYLKLRLDWLREDLISLPKSETASSLIEKISNLLTGDFNRSKKRKARDLIYESSRFLRKSVPCYPETHEMPTFEQRNNPEFRCYRCNEKGQCAFFYWSQCQPFRLAFFLN